MPYLPLGRFRPFKRRSRTRLEHWSRYRLLLGVVLPDGSLPQRKMDWYRAHQEHPCVLGYLVGIPLR